MSSGENILQTVKAAVQDVVAPDVRELKVEVRSLREQITSLERYVKEQFEASHSWTKEQFEASHSWAKEQFEATNARMTEQFEASHARTDAQFHAILAAIGQSKAENELMVYKQVSALTERMTVVESRLKQVESRAA